MKLGEFIRGELVLPELAAGTKKDVLEEMLAPVAGVIDGFDPGKALDVLLERERLGTTGIGDRIAIPHGKLDSLEEVLIVVGRHREGVDFEALDFKPCSIFFLVLAPDQVAGMHLRILAHISRLLKDQGFRDAFMNAPDSEALFKIVSSQ